MRALSKTTFTCFPQYEPDYDRIATWAQQRWGTGTRLMKFALDEQDIVKALGKGRSRKPFRYRGSAKLLSLQGLHQNQHQGSDDCGDL